MAELNRNTFMVIGTSLVVVSNEISRGQRTVIALTNVSTGAEVISLGFGGEATAGASVVLEPGASWVESIDSAFRPSNLTITAIANGAGALLAIHERIAGTGV